MGSYYGVERFRNATVDFRPVITTHEYTAAFGEAMRVVEDEARRGRLRHRRIDLGLLVAETVSRESLHATLCARLEIALLLAPLIPIAARSGRPDVLRGLMGLLP